MAESKRVSDTALKPTGGFRAELTGVDLAALLQMTCSRGERTVLRVRSGAREGFIYSADGRVVHAMLGFVTGESALFQMLKFGSGEFHVCERAWPTRYTIQESLDTLLIRAAHQEDDRMRISSTGILERPLAAAPAAKEIVKVPTSPPPAPPGALIELTREEGPLVASVRIDMNGDIVSQHGCVDSLAPLVAYVTRVGALLSTQLGLRAFEAMSADLGGQKALVFVEGNEMVGLLLAPGSMFHEIRQQLGV